MFTVVDISPVVQTGRAKREMRALANKKRALAKKKLLKVFKNVNNACEGSSIVSLKMTKIILSHITYSIKLLGKTG